MNPKRILHYLKKNGLLPFIKRAAGTVGYRLVSKPYLRALGRRAQPDPKRVVFVSSPDFSDNSRALYDYMAAEEKYAGYDLVWLVSDPHKYPADGRARFVQGQSTAHVGLTLAASRELLGAGFVFFTHNSPMRGLAANPRRRVVNLWHGCGYKKMRSTADWLGNNPCDCSLVPGPVFIETKQRFWNCSRESILPLGYPRYDEFYQHSAKAQAFAQALRGQSSRLVLWMPTYRKTECGGFAVEKMTGFFELPVVSGTAELQRLDAFCQKNGITVCIKRHPMQLRYQSEALPFTSLRFIDNADLEAAGVKLYQLLALTDGLITDYSSVAIDYLLLDKPMAFTLDDYDAYGDAQGFVFGDPLRYMPGSHVTAYPQLEEYLRQLLRGEDPHKADRAAIMAEVHNPCNGYCKRICDYLMR